MIPALVAVVGVEINIHRCLHSLETAVPGRIGCSRVTGYLPRTLYSALNQNGPTPRCRTVAGGRDAVAIFLHLDGWTCRQPRQDEENNHSLLFFLLWFFIVYSPQSSWTSTYLLELRAPKAHRDSIPGANAIAPNPDTCQSARHCDCCPCTYPTIAIATTLQGPKSPPAAATSPTRFPPPGTCLLCL